MRMKKWLLGAVLLVGAIGVEGQNVGVVEAIPLPAHPITAETLREMFRVTHFVETKKDAVAHSYDVGQAKLPPWYPISVWKEVEDEVLKIDCVEIALPIYRRYFSEEGGKILTRMFATPAGQAMLSAMRLKQKEEIQAGSSPGVAREKMKADALANANVTGPAIYKDMSKKERKEFEAYAQSGEIGRLNKQSDLAAMEFSVEYRDHQRQIANAVVTKHREELVRAKKEYLAVHPESANEDPAGK